MNNEIKEAIRQEDKKAKKGFWIFMAVGGVIGFFGGILITVVEDAKVITDFLAGLEEFIYGISNYVALVSGTISAIIVMILYKSARKEFAGWDGEDDAVETSIDQKLSIALALANCNLIFSYIFVPIAFVKYERLDVDLKEFLIGAGIHAAGVILCMVLAMAASVKIVNFAKEKNPEKHGSAYDMKFNSKWLKSSDEAEKLAAYKAAYKGYQVMSATCLILWMSCLVGMMLADWGLMPVFMVGIIWLAGYIGSNVEAIRLSKDTSKIQE